MRDLREPSDLKLGLDLRSLGDVVSVSFDVIAQMAEVIECLVIRSLLA